MSFEVSVRAPISFQPGTKFEDRLFQATMKSKNIVCQIILRKLPGELAKRRDGHNVIFLEQTLMYILIVSKNNESFILIHELDDKKLYKALGSKFGNLI